MGHESREAKHEGQELGISPEELRRQIEEYIAQCNEAEIFPDLAGMRIYLGISREELDKLRDENEAFREALDYAADCRESWLVRRMTRDNKVTQGCINALRQSDNGGYAEKAPARAKPVEIRFTGNIEPGDFL